MPTVAVQTHPIDNYIIRVRDRSTELGIREFINSYGLLMYFTLKPYLPGIVQSLGYTFAGLLTQKDTNPFYTRDGFLLFFPTQNDLSISITELTDTSVSVPGTEEKANSAVTSLDNIFIYESIESYLAKLSSGRLCTEDKFIAATRNLLKKNFEIAMTPARWLLKGIFKEISSSDVPQLSLITDDLYHATKIAYDQSDVTVPEFNYSNQESKSILPAYIFRIDAENINLTAEDVVNDLAAVSCSIYNKVSRFPIIEVANAFATFAKNTAGADRFWQNYKCITTYKTRIDLAADFLNSLFYQVFDDPGEPNDQTGRLKGFIATLRWLTLKPEILLFVAAQQATNYNFKSVKSLLPIPGLSNSDNEYAHVGLNHLVKEVAALSTDELKELRTSVYNQACLMYQR